MCTTGIKQLGSIRLLCSAKGSLRRCELGSSLHVDVRRDGQHAMHCVRGPVHQLLQRYARWRLRKRQQRCVIHEQCGSGHAASTHGLA